LGDLIGDIEVIVVANQLQFFDLSFKFGNGLLKVEIVQVHSFRKSCLKQRGGKGCRLLYATYPPTHSPEDSREGNWLSQSRLERQKYCHLKGARGHFSTFSINSSKFAQCHY